MSNVWSRSLRTAAMLSVAVGLAWILLGPLWALAATAIGLAAWQLSALRNLAALARWLGQPEAPVPAGTGAWQDVFAALHRHARERAQERQALSEALQRFRAAAEALPDGVIMLDRKNHIEWGNARAQAYLGLDVRRDAGQPIFNLIRQPEFLAWLQDGSGAPVVLTVNSQAERVLSLQLIPYGNEQKLLLCRDITELRRVAAMRRDFVANVSHELKTPLTVVVGFLETLRDLEPDAPERARYLQLMEEQARSMQRLVEDLLMLSALESRGNVLREEPVVVRALLESLYLEAKALSGGQHEISLEIACDSILLGAETELRSAFGNLVSNAVRYTPAGGAIGLSWQVAEGQGVFSVTDSGIGIEAQHIPRLTERFYRVDRSRSRATGGTGLGLAIVNHILVRHQATLKIASKPGKGSTFSAHFPAARLAAPQDAQGADVGEPASR